MLSRIRLLRLNQANSMKVISTRIKRIIVCVRKLVKKARFASLNNIH